MKSSFALRKLFQYFLQGLIILAPIGITIWAVTALFNFIDNILPDLIGQLFPHLLGTDAQGNPRNIPGLGFIVVIVIVILVGYISSSFIVGRLVALLDKVLERVPGIKLIYSTVKDFFEAFAGNKRKFNKPALINIGAHDVWRIGFITQQDVSDFGLHEHVAVYVPKSYAFTGDLYFVKRERVRVLPELSSGDAMKFAISGGVTDIDDDGVHHTFSAAAQKQ
ncbi:MAG TPA: DUF502 domain-containing protein [Flavitalea sp.]|nr:DUF502 domain-containing protein [Flavitalea sp.]